MGNNSSSTNSEKEDSSNNYVRITSPVRNNDTINHSGEAKKESSNNNNNVSSPVPFNNDVGKKTTSTDASGIHSPLPTIRRQPSYEIIDEKYIEKRRKQLINDIAKQLQITYSHALSLLRQ